MYLYNIVHTIIYKSYFKHCQFSLKLSNLEFNSRYILQQTLNAALCICILSKASNYFHNILPKTKKVNLTGS